AGTPDNPTFVTDLDEAGVPFVVALKPNAERKDDQDTTARLTEVARGLGWRSQRRPGAWQPVIRQFRDGHTETWWAAGARMGRWGRDGRGGPGGGAAAGRGHPRPGRATSAQHPVPADHPAPPRHCPRGAKPVSCGGPDRGGALLRAA